MLVQTAPQLARQFGEFPQAFSHIAPASSAMMSCTNNVGPSEERAPQS